MNREFEAQLPIKDGLYDRGEGQYGLHDCFSAACYICSHCGEMTALWNQA